MCEDDNDFTFHQFLEEVKKELSLDKVASWLGICPTRGDAQCPSDKPNCAMGVCVPRFGNGAPCLNPDDCKSGKCNHNICSECDSYHDCPGHQICLLQKTCVDRFDNYFPCISPNDCKSGKCNHQLCAECSHASDCSWNEFCLLQKECVEKFDNGIPCINGGDCKSGKCNLGTCSECNTSSDCSTGKYCFAGKGCVNKHGDFHPCTSGVMCKSGDCSWGTCSPSRTWGDGTLCVGGSSCRKCIHSATWWLRKHPNGYRCGNEPPKSISLNQQCYKKGDLSSLVSCWSKESLFGKEDIPLACFKLNYALNLNVLPGPHFLLLAAREEGANDFQCPSNFVFDYDTGGISQMHTENMSSAAKHLMGQYPLGDILEAQGKTKSLTRKDSEYNLETNTCVHYAKDVWRFLGLVETADLAEFIVEGVFNDPNFSNLATKHQGGIGYLSAKANGSQELRNYIKRVVYGQLNIPEDSMTI